MTGPNNPEGEGSTHDWHSFDVLRGYEVRTRYDLRRTSDGRIWRLSAEEFEQLRREGPNPQDIP
jgi:hypothetical protein